jgi:NAD(P)-dependent dehydrogenase (short-subunit alcohol dehydrogenase family)
MPTNNLQDKQILLAGGTGGLGSALATLLLAEGANLTLSYRHQENRARQWQSRAAVIQADITSAADRTRLLDVTNPLYAVVILVGDPARVTDPSQMESAMLQSHAVNYMGPILLAREAAQRMKAAAIPGAIVLISTM